MSIVLFHICTEADDNTRILRYAYQGKPCFVAAPMSLGFIPFEQTSTGVVVRKHDWTMLFVDVVKGSGGAVHHESLTFQSISVLPLHCLLDKSTSSCDAFQRPK